MPTNRPIRLIVGLGNPGAEYIRTRHNAGFWFVDAVARETSGVFREETKFKGEVCRVRIDGNDVWLLKPTTYMNASGQAVAALAAYYKIAPEEILVAHDELDIPPGCLKFKKGGGNAGHNGLKDITAQLGTPDFWRLRIGTGHPRTLGMAQQVFDFVLSAPSPEHRSAMDKVIETALKAVKLLAVGDLDRATRQLSPLGSLKKEKKQKEEKNAADNARDAGES